METSSLKAICCVFQFAARAKQAWKKNYLAAPLSEVARAPTARNPIIARGFATEFTEIDRPIGLTGFRVTPDPKIITSFEKRFRAFDRARK